MAFDDIFYQEILSKKEEFDNWSQEEQHHFSNLSFSSDSLNCELTFLEVLKSIDRAKSGKSYLEIPNDAMKNQNAKILLHKFFNFVSYQV